VPKNPLNSGSSESSGASAATAGAHGSTPEELGLEPIDEGVSGFGGVPVAWHETLDGVPDGPTILIAHEFFDAMPVHQFTRTERGWCERLVATRGSVARTQSESDEKDEDASGEDALEMVLSPGLTPAGALMIPRRLEGMPEDVKGGLRQLEISPRTLAIWERVAARVERHGGAALAVDYGEEGPIGDSLQAIKDHAFVPVLRDPGSADLSVYVDFGAMRQVIERRAEGEPSSGESESQPWEGRAVLRPGHAARPALPTRHPGTFADSGGGVRDRGTSRARVRGVRAPGRRRRAARRLSGRRARDGVQVQGVGDRQRGPGGARGV
jgi:hypothetical protein